MGNIALTIAGSDSSGGAGIQADLKTFSALGVYGCSVITAVTAQNTTSVKGIEEISKNLVDLQISSVLSDLSVDSIKLGMVFSNDIIDAIYKNIYKLNIPVVLDPVMISKTGNLLLKKESVDYLVNKLVPLSSLLTPNLPEASMILSCEIAKNISEMEEQGKALCEMGAPAVLIKGGHQKGDFCEDVLVFKSGKKYCFSSKRINTKNTHGTGCSFSSAITAFLSRGYDIASAVESAHNWLHEAIKFSDRLSVGKGHGPVNHFYHFWEEI